DAELPTVELQIGDKGEQVLALQNALLKIVYTVETSGEYDALTTWAITDIQLQSDNLFVSGIYNQELQIFIDQTLDKEKTITVASKLAEPNSPDEFIETVENPYEILVLVNKNYALPNDFEPHDLVVPDVRFPFSEDDPKKQLRKEAANALEEMFAAADN